MLLIAGNSVPDPESPATRFYAAFARVMRDEYAPPPGRDVTGLLEASAVALARRCAVQGATCPAEEGILAAETVIAALDDPHTRLDAAPAPAMPRATQAGASPVPALPTVPSAPLGWSVRQVRGTGERYVSWLRSGGPAERAGVRRFDLIDPSIPATAGALSRQSTPFAGVIHRGAQAVTINIMPETGSRGPTPRLDWRGRIAIVQVPIGLGEGTGQMVHDLVAEAQRRGARAIILDLRDNGGGGLECAVGASAFLDYGVVMTDRAGRKAVLSVSKGVAASQDSGDGDERLAIPRAIRWTGPLAVLVNRNTASCAEAVSIQVSLARRGIVVGEPSVGVGNNVVRDAMLPEGRRLHFTAAWVTTPEGVPLPPRASIDVAVDDAPALYASGGDEVLAAAIDALR